MDSGWVSGALVDASPLLALGLVILVGVLSGGVAQRIGLPRITGQILAGVALGGAGLDLLGGEAVAGLVPLTEFALGLIAVTVGAHLNLRRLRNAGRRLFYLLITEATVTPALVFCVIWGLGGASPSLAVLLATVSIATAPATIVSIVKETRSKGVFVKTLVAAVALNNMACIVLFEAARTMAHGGDASSIADGLSATLSSVLLAAAIGGGLGLAMDSIARQRRPEQLTTAAVIALLLSCGLATALDVSPLLACLFLGMVQTNLTHTPEQLVDSVFADFEPAILAVFFTLAGMHLSLPPFGLVGVIALLFFAARVAGKLASADLAMRLAGATDPVRRNLGMALVPQAGVAIGLVVLAQADPSLSEVSGLFTAIVLSVVTANEIIGPFLTRRALQRTGEIGRDRMRLIDFLQEENIATDFRAGSQEEAIEKLVDLMIHSHHLRPDVHDGLLESVLAREREGSTCLGGGLAVPHAILPEGQPMVGVMGLSAEGLDFPTTDGAKVQGIVLLGTSLAERERHLQVLAALARSVGTDPSFQAQLFNARSPGHAYELLHGDESEDFNYFLDDHSPDRIA